MLGRLWRSQNEVAGLKRSVIDRRREDFVETYRFLTDSAGFSGHGDFVRSRNLEREAAAMLRAGRWFLATLPSYASQVLDRLTDNRRTSGLSWSGARGSNLIPGG